MHKFLFMNITTTYSAWLIIFCLMAGGLYAYLLYVFRKNDDFSKKTNIFLFILRFITVSIIAFFLLSPFVKTVVQYTEKPILLIVQDNTESILINKDSAFYKNEYPALITDMTERLGDAFDVRTYSFGQGMSDSLNFRYNDKLTDLSNVFRYLSSTYYNKNVGAMVLATDGIYNAGNSPLYATEHISYPVYTIAMGDTLLPRDLLIEKINHNKVVFLNNNFLSEISVNAFRCTGEKAQLNVTYDNKKVLSRSVDIIGDKFIMSVPVTITADKPGKKKLTASLSVIKDEITTVNNTVSVFVDVIDSRQKILLVSNAPHPDIAALRQAIESNINYEVKHVDIHEFSGTTNDFSLVILHSLPSVTEPATELFRQLENSRVPLLYILGMQTNINSFNKLKTGLNISGSKANVFNEALPLLTKDFSLFVLSEPAQKTLLRLPPLISYFGNYTAALSAVTFLQQKIGAVATTQPLIMFNETSERKTGIIAGEGIWKWRLIDYLENGSHLASNEIINKTVQYLALKTEKDNFRVHAKDVYTENEAVIIDAEVYNDSYEIINTPEVNINITSEDKKSYTFAFSRTSNAYTLNAGLLPVGNYTYTARVKAGSHVYTKNGQFVISQLNKESINVQANHTLLYSLSKKHNAKMYYPAETEKLYQDITQNKNLKPVIYEIRKTTELVNIRWVLFLLVFLLGIEWFVRKLKGSY
ncbi:MAG: hypothetical protein BWY70_00621 [Bacteroidetes bacterium ADurb.Bin408]|nr:MAG: hypothetical protein BWY70_00621 [Bacteroidetes bacterium ADurb.Bin408]